MERDLAHRDHADRPAAQFVAVAVGTVEHAPPPTLPQAFYLRQRIGDAVRQHQPFRLMPSAVRRHDAKAGAQRLGMSRLSVMP